MTNADDFRENPEYDRVAGFACDVCGGECDGRFLHLSFADRWNSIDIHEDCDVAQLFEPDPDDGTDSESEYDGDSCFSCDCVLEGAAVYTRKGQACRLCADMFADRRNYVVVDGGTDHFRHLGPTIINIAPVGVVPKPPGYVEPDGRPDVRLDRVVELLHSLPRVLEETSLLRLRYVGALGSYAIYVLCDDSESPVWAFPTTRESNRPDNLNVPQILFNTWRGFQTALRVNQGSLAETLTKLLKLAYEPEDPPSPEPERRPAAPFVEPVPLEVV